ncbi:hypothetical protein ACT4R9_02415 [Ornithobacterium rhinotracheale]|uniref:hypothetical protein n=1 Tax=Ornithobacterium rhinotracheale TaxID=28251 RepID=UPI003FA4CEC5
MKKILLSFGLCLAVTAGYAQSKEAKKEIRKYYTEKQIKYIEKELKNFIDNKEDSQYHTYIFLNYIESLPIGEDSIYFNSEDEKRAYINYFLPNIERTYIYDIVMCGAISGVNCANFSNSKD